jgi:hypothetical protein
MGGYLCLARVILLDRLNCLTVSLDEHWHLFVPGTHYVYSISTTRNLELATCLLIEDIDQVTTPCSHSRPS